ncbi:MAG: hypothetical protein TREMPRED_004057 [Tremellales sp. Tagirdzhanova-0007]|nr:MAG: hypothetical protein TREMPRED_004057 [Tremellales sp. Tagirdzhanova-0007]
MPRSIFQIIVLPYLHRTAFGNGTRAFSTTKGRSKDAADVEVGSYSDYPLHWSESTAWSASQINHEAPTTILRPSSIIQTAVNREPASSHVPTALSRAEPPHLSLPTLPSTPHPYELNATPRPESSRSTAWSRRALIDSGPTDDPSTVTRAGLSDLAEPHPIPFLLPEPASAPWPEPTLSPSDISAAYLRFPSTPHPDLPPHARIAALAFHKIIEAHTPKPDGTRGQTTRYSKRTDPRQSSSSIAVTQSNPRTLYRQANPSTGPPLPPVLHRLIAAHLYRMAVFHFLHTPEYASDSALMDRLAGQLEVRGAGKLAHRLRRGWEMPRLPWPSDSDNSPLRRQDPSASPKDASLTRGMDNNHSSPLADRATLWTDTEVDSPRKPHSYWSNFVIPPAFPPPIPDLTRQQQIQHFFNCQLSYLLTKPADPYALSSLGFTPRAPGASFPAPEPSLRQLGRLLVLIEKMERNQSFVPNRVTANIIIRCWLRCGLGSSHSAPDAQPMYYLMRGKWTRKRASTARFGSEELRAVLEVTSRAMLAEKNGSNGENRLEYVKHVRPFCKMIKRAARELGDREVFGRAVHMQVSANRLWRDRARLGLSRGVGRKESIDVDDDMWSGEEDDEDVGLAEGGGGKEWNGA